MSAFVGHDRFLSLIDEDHELPPLFPLQGLDYAGFAFAAFGLILAAGGGIGGGGILVPVYILVLDFPVKHAIPLASVTVLGGAVANNLINWRKPHPVHKNRNLIDWDLIVLLEPPTIAGALVGADLNDLLPDIVIIVILLALLGFTAQKTLKKAYNLHQQENLTLMAEENMGLIDGGMSSEPDYSSVVSSSDPSPLEDAPDLKSRSKSNCLKLTCLFVLITLLNLLKGGPEMGGHGRFAVQTCGIQCFWAVEALMLIAIFGFSVFFRYSILVELQAHQSIPSDIVWDNQNTLRYPAIAIVAGLVAGLFGIGGGIVKGPLLLALGVHPAVASASSACMILYTSATATICFQVFGLLVWDYSMMCFAIGLFATFIGQTVMTAILAKYERNSYIAFSIGGVVALSAVCMALESVMAIVGD